jgi:hypothetical protein
VPEADIGQAAEREVQPVNNWQRLRKLMHVLPDLSDAHTARSRHRRIFAVPRYGINTSAEHKQQNLRCSVVLEALQSKRRPIFYLEENGMTKLFSWLFAAAFALGLAAAPTLTYADHHEKDPVEEAEEGGEESSDDDKKE